MRGGWSLNAFRIGDNLSNENEILITLDAGGAVVETNKVSSRTDLGSWNYRGEDRCQVMYTFIKRQ